VAAAMDFVLQVLLRVVMRRSIRRLQEVVDIAVDIGTAAFVAVRVSGLVFRRRLPTPTTTSSSSTTYYVSTKVIYLCVLFCGIKLISLATLYICVVLLL
jgi:ribosomal protein S3AE